MGIQKEKVASSKPMQESGGAYDEKLVEMINTAIVDRSPSVKWEDVGKNLFSSYGHFNMNHFHLWFKWDLLIS